MLHTPKVTVSVGAILEEFTIIGRAWTLTSLSPGSEPPRTTYDPVTLGKSERFPLLPVPTITQDPERCHDTSMQSPWHEVGARELEATVLSLQSRSAAQNTRLGSIF